MRLNFQIMCFVIFLSVTQLEFSQALRSKRLQSNHYNCNSHTVCGKEAESNNRMNVMQAQRASLQRNSYRDSNAKSQASGIAVKAAQEARRANDDMAGAVKIASDRIKLEYAEKAAVAAKAAEAVLAAKMQVLEQLEMEVREAECVLQDETQELSAVEANCQLARKAHQQAEDELQLLHAGAKLAKANLESSEQVSSACQATMLDKSGLLEAAQKRVSALLRQLSDARNDYAKTKKAAYKALCAANEAKQRINYINQQSRK